LIKINEIKYNTQNTLKNYNIEKKKMKMIDLTILETKI